jgi:hypothetical protein
MEPITLLKEFGYSVPTVLAHAKANKNQAATEFLPLMKVAIDFENCNLQLEGDWNFMMASNKYNEASWFDYHIGRVKIETTIYASMPINLDDLRNNGLAFPLEGSIRDDGYYGFCTGLLVLDHTRSLNGLLSDQWNIIFYLYDLQFDDCEITFKLPLFTGSSNNINKN